ncbi:MAG: DUF4400 domain-containing protein [Sulfuricaulis sp.]
MIKAAFYFWLFILAEVLIVVSFLGRPSVESQIGEEHTMSVAWMGDEADASYARAYQKFKTIFVDSGAVKTSYDAFLPTTGEQPRDSFLIGSFDWFQGRLEVLWAVILRAFQRSYLIIEWMPYTLLSIIPAAVDGWNQRAIKRVSFGYASPVRFHSAMFSLLLFVFLPFFYLFAPFAIHPLAILVWSFCGSITFLVLSSNTQKVL